MWRRDPLSLRENFVRCGRSMLLRRRYYKMAFVLRGPYEWSQLSCISQGSSGRPSAWFHRQMGVVLLVVMGVLDVSLGMLRVLRQSGCNLGRTCVLSNSFGSERS